MTKQIIAASLLFAIVLVSSQAAYFSCFALCNGTKPCPQPGGSGPNCSTTPKSKCNSTTHTPSLYLCQTGNYKYCKDTVKEDDVCYHLIGEMPTCGNEEYYECAWNDQAKTCDMAGSCSIGPCTNDECN